MNTTHQQSEGGGASRSVVVVIIVLALVIGVLLSRISKDSHAFPLRKLDTVAPTPAAEIMYHQVSHLDTGFRVARGMALSRDGVLYVVGDQAVARFDRQGQRSGLFPLMDTPRCLAIAADGTLFIGMAEHVEVYAQNGMRKAIWGSLGRGTIITALAIAGKDLWVADAGQREVALLDHRGTVLRRFGKRDDARKNPGLVVPSPYLDVAVGADGTLVLTNPGRHTVEYYHATGDFIRAWGSASNADDGFAGCCNPTNIVLLSDGRVVTSEKGLPRVKLYSAAGRYLGMIAPPELFHPATVGLALAADAQGHVYVLDTTQNAVRIFAAKG
jgi:hypothetical protein